MNIYEIVQLAALALMIGSATALAKICSPGSISGNQESEGEGERLKKFSEYSPQLQRGMLSYAERMRKSYQKGGK
ncbi:MAG: hypothetical protein HWN68_08185 [Desulfobacterales bacterium]|nr:hypothetical protein [Desulfobacterales bacterium]